ncbi:MAG: formylglycine-generating enzyme family protein [Muribaculaceae bacterium]
MFTKNFHRCICGCMAVMMLLCAARVAAADANRTFTVKGVSFTMIAVEGGTFVMGCDAQPGEEASADEAPVHQVTMPSFYIGETVVTQALWNVVMGKNPSDKKDDESPVEMVSWNDCQHFISRLNKLTGEHFSLPTEAAWEFAARGGNKGGNSKYSGSNNVNNVCWSVINSHKRTHKVKTLQPNELGIYDMSGNVWEWCADWYADYGAAPQTNPQGPYSGSFKVVRGGCFNVAEWYCRITFRSGFAPIDRGADLGFRLYLKAE